MEGSPMVYVNAFCWGGVSWKFSATRLVRRTVGIKTIRDIVVIAVERILFEVISTKPISFHHAEGFRGMRVASCSRGVLTICTQEPPFTSGARMRLSARGKHRRRIEDYKGVSALRGPDQRHSCSGKKAAPRVAGTGPANQEIKATRPGEARRRATNPDWAG